VLQEAGDAVGEGREKVYPTALRERWIFSDEQMDRLPNPQVEKDPYRPAREARPARSAVVYEPGIDDPHFRPQRARKARPARLLAATRPFWWRDEVERWESEHLEEKESAQQAQVMSMGRKVSEASRRRLRQMERVLWVLKGKRHGEPCVA
jgi:hypothetical protein